MRDRRQPPRSSRPSQLLAQARRKQTSRGRIHRLGRSKVNWGKKKKKFQSEKINSFQITINMWSE